MTISSFRSWPHALSYYYKIPLRQARALLKLGLLPDEAEGGCPDRPASIDPFEDAAIDALEARRAQFDNSVEQFVESLHITGGELANDRWEWPHDIALTEFRSFTYGRLDRLYPVARYWKPWRGHRVAVTQSELIAADYADLHKLLVSSPYETDPFGGIPIDGAVPLGAPDWCKDGASPYRPSLNVQRGQFLLRLADVLEVRA